MSFTTIKIGDKQVGLRFGYPCIRWFIEAVKEDRTLFYEDDNLTDLGIAKLIQAAYRNDCVVKEVKPELKFESFNDWVESNLDAGGQMSDELTEVIQVFNGSLPVKKLNENQEKKSQTDLIQSPSPTLTESKESVSENAE